MKVFVGTITRAGHVTVDGPHMVTAHGGRWFIYIPQGVGDPIVAVRHGATPNFDTMGDGQAVNAPDPGEETAFMPAFRAVLTNRGGKLNLEVTEPVEVSS